MDGWKIKTFANCAQLVKETYQPNESESLHYIGLEHIEQGTLKLLSSGKSSEVKSQKFKFKKDDILFGKLRPYFRKVIRTPFDGVCSTDIFVVRAKPGIDQDFLYYMMASKEFVDYASQGTEGTRMPRAAWDFLEMLKLEIPELDEQKSISATLNSLDNQIHVLDNQNLVLEKIIQSIFKSWFIDFEGQTKFVDSELGEIPKGWIVVPIGNVIELAYGKSLTKDKRESGPIPVYGSSGIVGYHNQSLANGPGIIVGRKGNVGSLFWSENDFYAIDTVYYVKTNIPLHYVYQNFKNQNFINSDSSVPGLQREQAYALSFLIPDEGILLKFENYCNIIRNNISSNTKMLDILTKIRDSLLPKLISGEIKVKN